MMCDGYICSAHLLCDHSMTSIPYDVLSGFSITICSSGRVLSGFIDDELNMAIFDVYLHSADCLNRQRNRSDPWGTNFERSVTIQVAPNPSSWARSWLVHTASTLEPAATPEMIPDGASSTTMPTNVSQKCHHTKPTLLGVGIDLPSASYVRFRIRFASETSADARIAPCFKRGPAHLWTSAAVINAGGFLIPAVGNASDAYKGVAALRSSFETTAFGRART